MSEMIYFQEEYELLRQQIRRFVQEEVEPHGESWEEAGKIPREVLQKMGGLGLFGMRYPEAMGGSGLNAMASVILAEELGRSTFGGFTATVMVHTDMASPHLANAGNERQIKDYMPGIVSGETVCAVAVTEPDAGSDVAGIKTKAEKDGNHYVLNGSKMFITNGVHAELFFVAAKTDTKVKGSRGISMFIVEQGTPGFSVSKKLQKLGWRCSDTALLSFDQCRIPAQNLLGDENKGFYAIMKNFQNERLVLSAQAVGESQKALELTLEYVKFRKAFGGVLFDKQVIRQRLAMLVAKVDAARQYLYHCAWLDAQGRDYVKEVSGLKSLCGELVNEVMYECLQFHGGAGYLQESPIERMFRDARVINIGGGATEVMLEEVAKRL